MARRRSKKRPGNSGCVLNAVLGIMAVCVLVSFLGGSLMLEAGDRQAAYPHLPINPATLHVQPSMQTFSVPPTPMPHVVVYQAPAPTPVVVPFIVQPNDCTAQVTQLVPGGWAVGVSRLPDCWDTWTATQQDLFIRTQRGLP